MGLDIVELIIAIEERFDIAIPDDGAEKLATVGDMHRYLCRRLQGIRHRACTTQRTFYQVRRALMRTTDVPRWYVRPGTHLDLALPAFPARRKHALQRLRHETGVKLALDPGERLTVGSLVQLSVAQADERRGYSLAVPPDGWTSETVWDALQEVIVSVIVVEPREVRPGARFVEDLRID